jgi:hypothetical protein
LIACSWTALFAPAACGYGGAGYQGGQRTVQVLGGALRPNKLAYALTPTSDVVGATRRPNGLASAVDLRREGLVPPVQNQRFNDCVGWSLGYYTMTGVWARAVRTYRAGRFLDLTNPENWFSPAYIYSQRDASIALRSARAAEDPGCRELDDEVGCMRPEQALGILVRSGCSTWTWMGAAGESPPDGGVVNEGDPAAASPATSRPPWTLASIGASSYRPRCYVRFGELGQFDADTRGRMQAWLHEQGTPISIVVRMRSGWVGHRGENRRQVVVSEDCVAGGVVETRGVCLDAMGDDLGGQHMMTVIGYDNVFPNADLYPGLKPEHEGSFLVVNQWGTKWGQDGTMWIPYEELRKIWVAGYGLIGPDLDNPGGGRGECVQDPVTGAYEVISEPDDVPFNLNAAGTDTELTATVLQVPPVAPFRVTLPGRAVGATNAQGQDDVADWYVFDVTDPAGSVVEVSGGAAPAQGLRILVTDDRFREVGRGEGLWRGRICTNGTYFIKVHPAADVPRGTSLAYDLTVALTPGAPAWVLEPDDEICGANVLGAAEGDPTLKGGTLGQPQDPIDWVDYWSYDVPADGEYVVELATDDVAVITYEGETAESALPVAWTATALRGPYGPRTSPAVLDLGRRRQGEVLWFAVVRYAWALAAYQARLPYDLRVRACPQGCAPTPSGRFRLPPRDDGSPRFQLLRSWTWASTADRTPFRFQVDSFLPNEPKEVRVVVEDLVCPPEVQLQVTANVAYFGSMTSAVSRLVQARGGDVALPVPWGDRLGLMSAGTQAGVGWAGVLNPGITVDVLPVSMATGGPATGCTYRLRIEEWGVGPASQTPIEIACPSPSCIATGPQLDAVRDDWFLIQKWNWNQPWYTWYWESYVRGWASYAEPSLMANRTVLAVDRYCEPFEVLFQGQVEQALGTVVQADLGSVPGAVFQRLELPAEQPESHFDIGRVLRERGHSTAMDHHPTGDLLGHVWMGLRGAAGQPLTDYAWRLWDEVTLANWAQEVRAPDRYLPSHEVGSPARAVRLGALDAGAVVEATGTVDSFDRFDFYRVPVSGQGLVRLDLEVDLSSFGPDPRIQVAVWDATAQPEGAWVRGAQGAWAQSGSQPIEIVVPSDTTLTVVVEALFRDREVRFGYSVPYTLTVSR